MLAASQKTLSKIKILGWGSCWNCSIYLLKIDRNTDLVHVASRILSLVSHLFSPLKLNSLAQVNDRGTLLYRLITDTVYELRSLFLLLYVFSELIIRSYREERARVRWHASLLAPFGSLTRFVLCCVMLGCAFPPKNSLARIVDDLGWFDLVSSLKPPLPIR